MSQIDPTSIEQTYLAYHYTLYINIYIYQKEMNLPGQSSIDALHTVTLYIYIYI